MKLLLPLVCFTGLVTAFGSVACTCDQGKLQEQLRVQNKQLTELTKQLQLQNEQLQLQDKRMESLEKTAMSRTVNDENQIAFSVASHDHFGPVTVDTNIPFPVVYTNVGDTWNPVINAFQATKAGFYLFTASFRGNTDGTTKASIVHTTTSGSQRVAALYSHTSVASGDANSVIIQVAIGDYVSVHLHGASGSIGSSSGEINNVFSGHFLFP